MKVLVAGVLSPMQWAVIKRLSEEGHRVTALGMGEEPLEEKTRVERIALPLTHATVEQIFASHRFDAVVFFLAYESTAVAGVDLPDGLMDGLYRLHRYAQQYDVAHFLLISDSRVFGQAQGAREDEHPQPDSATGRLLQAAEDSFAFTDAEGMKTTLIRVTNLYAPNAQEGFFQYARRCALERTPLVLPGGPQSPCDFLHVDDLALFLNMAVEVQLTGVVHLAHGADLTQQDMVDWMREYLPDLEVRFSEEPVRTVLLSGERAFLRVRWVSRYLWVDDLPQMLGGAPMKARRKRKTFRLQSLLGSAGQRLAPWAVLLGLGAAAQWCTQITERFALFRFVDFWLFYVILMGSLYGTLLGASAGVAASVAYVVDWVQGNGDIHLLWVNVDHWLPFVMYLLCGSIFGFIRRGQMERIQQAQREQTLLEEKLALAQDSYRQASKDREQLLSQVMHSRDSFGRIYAITQALDSLQPAEVLHSTLQIVEDLMQSWGVAVYLCAEQAEWGRLMLCSSGVERRLPKSLRFGHMPGLMEAMRNNELFDNKQLDPALPDFAVPIRRDGRWTAMVALWELPIERRTLYYQNLMRVVAGLVEAALMRAYHFSEQAADLYVEGTRLLCETAFRALLETHLQMRERQVASYLLIRLDYAERQYTVSELDTIMQVCLRATDACALDARGVLYALLPQAGPKDLDRILSRFVGEGLLFDLVPQGRMPEGVDA